MTIKTDKNDPASELETALKRLKDDFLHHPYPPLKTRIERLQRLRTLLLTNQKQLAAAIDKDFGTRSFDETYLGEINVLMAHIKHIIKKLPKWIKPSKRVLDLVFLPGRSYVHYQPKGVVGVIAPWNYPLLLTLAPAIDAIAAGNRVMLKLSEHTPKTSALLATLINEIFSDTEFRAFCGDTELGKAFTSLPFDHLIFTGSTAVGREVMIAAAKNLTPVTLELGGKSPAVISDNIAMEDAVSLITFGKLFNSGQTCIAPDYLFCPESRVDDFVQCYQSSVKSCYPTLATNDDYTSIINQRQYQRLIALLEDAKTKGAKIVEVNPSDEVLSESNKIAPTLVLNPTDEMAIMQQEIFGPLLPILTYRNIDDVLEYINTRPRPLALYYYGYNQKEQQRFLEETTSGGVCINDVLSHAAQSSLPFGGSGDSGIGRYHGYEGFIELSNQRGVVAKGKLNTLRFALPPYRKAIHKLIKWLNIR